MHQRLSARLPSTHLLRVHVARGWFSVRRLGCRADTVLQRERAALRRLSFALTKRIETGPAVKVESRAIVNLNLKSEKRGKSRRPPPSPNYRDYAHRTATLASERRGPPPSSRFSRLTASAIWRSRGVPSRRRRVQDPRTVTLPLDSPPGTGPPRGRPARLDSARRTLDATPLSGTPAGHSAHRR